MLQALIAAGHWVLSQAEARSGALPPGPGRDMSFEEKRKLSHALSGLPHERLTAVMEIVEQDPNITGREVRLGWARVS